MEINHVFRFEELRDGGSLIVSFQSTDSCSYWIMFPIVNLDGDCQNYGTPILVNRTTGIEVELSAMGAKQWLKKIHPYFEERPDLECISRQAEVHILNKMLALCGVVTS